MSRRVAVAILAAVLLSLPGCIVAAAAVGAAAYGAISYHENEAWLDVQQDLPTVWAASKRALRAQAFPVDDTAMPSTTEGTLRAGDAKVAIERHPGNRTRIRASVGTFDTDDNERRAKLLLEAIQKELGV